MDERKLEPQLAHEIQLVHAEAGRRVVLVQARRGGQLVDAALGEAATAEEAEDRARQRLEARQVASAPPQPVRPSAATQASAPTTQRPTPAPGTREPASTTALSARPDPNTTPDTVPSPPQPEEPPADPEDWSAELAQLDLQLRRVGWDRDQEGIYLERVFGHPNRNRLTHYGDLLAYLQVLQGLAPGDNPTTAPAPLRRRDLLNQCDQLLGQLQWDPGQGRAFLEQHFSLSSRQQLSDAQLLEFNMLLESEWLTQQPANPTASAPLNLQ